MQKRHRLVAALLVCGAFFNLPQTHAAESATQTLVIKDAWLRATPKGAKVAGGYVTITNTGAAPDSLTGASIPGAAAGEIHSMTMENGIMHMGRLDSGLAIAPGATVTLAPGGNHIMFMNPAAPFKEGETVTGSLAFKGAGTVPVTFAVGGMAAKTAPTAMDHGTMDMGGMKMDGMDMKGMDMKTH